MTLQKGSTIQGNKKPTYIGINTSWNFLIDAESNRTEVSIPTIFLHIKEVPTVYFIKYSYTSSFI